MLGLHPGPEISVPAAASLAGMSTTQARAALARLHRGSLVLELTPGRYALHDLLRRYAIELHLRHDGAEDRHDATRRMLDHYTHAAYAAARQLTPHRPTVSFPPTAPDNPETIDRPDVAVAWFRAEQPVLQSLVQRTEAAGFHSHTWLLAWSLRDFYHQQGHWRHMQAVHEAALDAAEHLQDKPRAAYAHRTLGIALGRLGRFDSAGDHLAKALELSSSVSDYAGMASAENCLIEIAIASGHSEAAAEYAQQALIHFQMAGDRRGEMHALNGLAWASLHLGAHEDALRYGERALAVLEEVAGAHAGFAHIFANLGHAHHGLGEHPQAISNLQQALSLAQEVDDQPLEAEILVAMGDLHHAVGDDCQARDAWCRAERILRTFGDPGADDVLAKLVRE